MNSLENTQPQPENPEEVIQYSSPQELRSEPIALKASQSATFENFGVNELPNAPTAIGARGVVLQQWKFPSGVKINGRPVLQINVEGPGGLIKQVDIVDISGAHAIDTNTLSGSEEPRIRKMYLVGGLRDEKRYAVSRTGFFAIESTPDGTCTSFSDIESRGVWASQDGVSVSVADGGKLQITNESTEQNVSLGVAVPEIYGELIDQGVEVYKKRPALLPPFKFGVTPPETGITPVDPVTGNDYVPKS